MEGILGFLGVVGFFSEVGLVVLLLMLVVGGCVGLVG
jgi:hypothetical protein